MSLVATLKGRVRLDKNDPYQAWLDSIIHPARVGVSSDGQRYMAMAEGQRVPTPFHYRWLLPWLLGTDVRRWEFVTDASLLGMVPAMRWMTGRWSSGLFLFSLPGAGKGARVYPVLTDSPAQLAAVVSAGAARRGHWVLSVGASLVAGALKESAPGFAALYAFSPLPLVGFLAPGLRHLLVKPGPDVTSDYSHEVLRHPFATAWVQRRGRAHDPRLWLTSWGGLLAGLLKPDARTVSTLVAAYGQCARSFDSTRLYQWAWPVLAENVSQSNLWLAALVAGWFNPLGELL